MRRYIDADKAKEKKVYSEDRHEYVVPVAELDWLATADVQEVKHGRWIEQVKIRKNGEPRLVYWQCSLCGVFLGTNTANFCPHCGAKMDEEGRL